MKNKKIDSKISAKTITNWTIYGPVSKDIPTLTANEFSQIKTIPKKLTLANTTYTSLPHNSTKGKIDFAKLFYSNSEENFDSSKLQSAAYLFTEITCEKATTIWLGAGADWWMQWFLNGKEIYSTLATGNNADGISWKNHAFKLDLQKGKNIFSAIIKSGSNGWQVAYGGDNSHKKELKKIFETKKEELKQQQKEIERLQKDMKANSKLKLAIFGSSVAEGAGADNNQGWAYHLTQQLKKRNWKVVNKSIGGDNTIKLLARIKRDLLPEKPDMVIIGLSLSNEGLKEDAEKTYFQFCHNMKKLIQLCHKNNIIPIISNCYPNNEYNQMHYNYIKRFNQELNSWPVYSINFLGSTDDGQGHWCDDHWVDNGHPNSNGHEQMFYAIPPSLFDNIIYPHCAQVQSSNSWLSHSLNKILKFSPTNTIKPFCFSFRVQFEHQPKRDCSLACINNNKITINKDGFICYQGQNKQYLVSNIEIEVNKPYFFAISYSYARKTSNFYINGEHIGHVIENFKPECFILAGDHSTSAPLSLYKDLAIYRSSLNKSEIHNLYHKTYLRSSLELFAPLNDSIITDYLPLTNMAPTDAALYYQNITPK